MKEKRIFSDKNKLLEMLVLRRDGWTFYALAKRYDCDRTTLRYQCRKYQVFPNKTRFLSNSDEVFDPQRIVIPIIADMTPDESQWVVIEGERINTGRDYKDYLRLSRYSPYK